MTYITPFFILKPSGKIDKMSALFLIYSKKKWFTRGFLEIINLDFEYWIKTNERDIVFAYKSRREKFT